MDVQGRAWVAGFFGQAVTCWDMNAGEMVDQIKVLAKGPPRVISGTEF